MRAAWWWIDRWRQSTAYIDMNAEEQGLYRNLCDEVWLRDGHAIPEASLARASGDENAWERCREKVLQWMKKTPEGWTNKTALEVIGQAKRRAKKQKDYRNRRGNGVGNAAGNDDHNDPGSPSPSPSPSLSQTTNNGKRTSGRAAGEKASPGKETWLTPYAEAWKQAFGGTAPMGEIARTFKPLADEIGRDELLARWKRYLGATEARYASPTKFSQTAGAYAPPPPAQREEMPWERHDREVREKAAKAAKKGDENA